MKRLLRYFRDANVWLSNKTTPHALFESRGFAIYDLLTKGLVLDPEVTQVIDVGAGRESAIAATVRQRSNVKLIGMDVDATELALNEQLDQKVVCDASKMWPTMALPADLIVSRATIEHLPDNQQFIRSAFLALRPGGKLAVVFASKWAPPVLLNRMIPNWLANKLLKALVPNADGKQGFRAHYDLCTYRAFYRALEAEGFRVTFHYCSYYSSSYFQFFFPLHFLSILMDMFRMTLGIRSLASQCVFLAQKP